MSFISPPRATAATLYFIGVTTKASSIRTVFPRWAGELGIDAVLDGMDLPVHAPVEDYRAAVRAIADDPLAMGALVTTHKVDLYTACADMFDVIDPLAELMGEVSCISKDGDKLVAHAKDPFSSGYAIDHILGGSYWQDTPGEAFIMGAGGSGIAIAWYLTRPSLGLNRPRRLIVSNRSKPRTDNFRRIYEKMDTGVPLELVVAGTPDVNDRLLELCGPGSLVVNATGLGKDAPGSPLTKACRFPHRAVAWDLNYRGDLGFLEQARAQADQRALRVEDGWFYFLHGWIQAIAEVFHRDVPVSGPAFDRLSELARSVRRPS
ncbi:shikimate dehydrogenase family protein [Streptomyces sp. MMS24-I2-30]|uniref:shikimate dehydrogenase family protein n=1 Tax=Streptomyces sp. MMS24-I2-30 TaxID=3351564 RepID=UPI0038969F19